MSINDSSTCEGQPCIPGARPNNDISVEFEIRQKFAGLWFKMYSTDHNEILHTSRQLHCRDVCKISLWSVTYILNWSTPNFDWISNSIEISLVGRAPGARFTNDFSPAIQIRWKIRLAVIPLLAIRSQQIFAHATTAQLSCHVQNFVAITVLESRWEWNEISIDLELRWKNR